MAPSHPTFYQHSAGERASRELPEKAERAQQNDTDARGADSFGTVF